MHKPAPHEYGPYYETYVGLISPGENILRSLEQEFHHQAALLDSLSKEKQLYAYADGKWTIREVVGHLADTERIMSYRALCLSRGDKTPLPGFDQDPYVETGRFNRRTMKDLLAEWTAIRHASLMLGTSLSGDMASEMGTASGLNLTARGALGIILGHARHHMAVLKERYEV